MRLPTNNPVTFPYGATTSPYTPSNPHAGTDYAYRLFSPHIYAPEKIRVTAVGNMGTCGTGINATGQDGRKYRFCHLHSEIVDVGKTYAEGTPLGKIGDTGFAFGEHLHFVMWVNGSRVDPDKTIKGIMIKESQMNDKQVDWLHRAVRGRPASLAFIKQWRGKTHDQLSKAFMPEGAAREKQLQADKKKINNIKKEVC